MTIAAVTVPVMHEQVDQRAGGDQQLRQRAEYVGGVFGEQEEPGHTEEAEGDNPGRGSPPGPFLVLFLHGGYARRRKKL